MPEPPQPAQNKKNVISIRRYFKIWIDIYHRKLPHNGIPIGTPEILIKKWNNLGNLISSCICFSFKNGLLHRNINGAIARAIGYMISTRRYSPDIFVVFQEANSSETIRAIRFKLNIPIWKTLCKNNPHQISKILK